MNMNEVQLEESRGSMLLASVMTVSFGVLMFLGVVSSTMSEKLRTDQVVQTATALQLAHSGVEYALWEINYGGPDYTGTGWAAPVGAAHTYTGIPGVTVTVTDPLTDADVTNDSNPITVTSRGQSTAIGRTVNVQVPARSAAPPPGPGIFNQILFTNSDTLHLYAVGGGSIEINGYNSTTGENPLITEPVIIRNDTLPFRKTTWNTSINDPLAAPIILEGNVTTTNVKLIFRTPAAGELAPPGYELVANGVAVKGGASFPAANIVQDPSDTGLGVNPFPIKAGVDYDPAVYGLLDTIDPGIYSPNINPSTEVMVICPNENLIVDQVTVQNATLAMGCTLAPGRFNCDDPTDPVTGLPAPFKDIYGGPKNGTGTCSGATPSQKVTISSAQGSLHGYTLAAPALSVAGTGKIIINSPTEIYYNGPGAGNVGFDIRGNGIENLVTKASGAIDPAAFAIYGGKNGSPDGHSATIATATPFRGAVFNPQANVSFEAAGVPMDFFGSLNIRSLRTNAQVKLHWDAALKNTNTNNNNNTGPCDPILHNCRVVVGTWSLTNN